MRKKIFNCIIVILVLIGVVMMLTHTDDGTGLMTTGIANFKYYTVLSNVFAGIVAFIALFINNKAVRFMKLMSAAVTGVTFAVVAFFLAPLYGFWGLYQNANFLFHLVIPLIAMFDYIFSKESVNEIKFAALSAIPTFFYGCGYMLNILINGKGGEYPDTNDFYLFLNWGWGVGIIIFLCIVLLTFGIACLLRFGNKLYIKKRG